MSGYRLTEPYWVFGIGDSVVVKSKGVDPDLGVDIGGWCGRVAEEPNAEGFVLEDADNSRNGTVYAGGPFQVAHILDKDLLDLIGLVKMLLRMVNVENTRDVAVLVYYTSRPVFNYQARFSRGEQVEFDANGQFVVTEVPRLFKLRIDSDLSSPYGDPMQGTLIYLNQHPQPGVLVGTLGLMAR